MGDPREVTAGVHPRGVPGCGIEPISSYPRAAGLPELREAIAGWVERRFGVTVDAGPSGPAACSGSKELVFSLAQAVLDPAAGKDSGARDGARVHDPRTWRAVRGRRRAVRLPLTEAKGFLPDLDAIDDATWDRAAILWLNYPNNPTGAVAPLAFLADAAERCRAHDVLLASDEAYSELWFERAAAARARSRWAISTNVLAINTLSKRSSMTGYRSGFAAGDPDLIAALKALRPSVGVTPQEFVQRASVAAWNDEAHVEDNRRRYAAKRADLPGPVRAPRRRGRRQRGHVLPVGEGARPGGRRWTGRSSCWNEPGSIVAPGSFFGPEGEGYVRMAMVPTVAECGEAAASIDGILAAGGAGVTTRTISPRGSRRPVGSPTATPRRGGRRGRDRAARSGRGSRRRARRRRRAGRVNEWAKKAVLLYFRVRGTRDHRVGPFEYHDKLPLKHWVRRAAGVRVVPPGDGSVRRVPLAGRRADAQLRQHRRLGRAGHDGRHVGHGRLVRPDRRRRAPGRRRGDRWRARAAAGRAR